jgi:3-dehydrosphinganine reductase
MSLASVLARAPVLIIGGSSGIGLALAHAFRARGGAVHLVARDSGRLDNAGRAVGAAAVHRCDVTDPEGVRSLLCRLADAGQAPGVVVNSAGVVRPGRFLELAPEHFRDTMETNYFGTLHVLRAALPFMLPRGEGYILNVSSLAGLLGVYGLSTYAPAKFAVTGLSLTLRAELKPRGIGVSVLCPPDTDTPMLHAEVCARPPETEALSPSANALSAPAVAEAALRGLARRHAVIVPGARARWIWRAHRLFPGVVERFMDRIIRGGADGRTL